MTEKVKKPKLTIGGFEKRSQIKAYCYKCNHVSTKVTTSSPDSIEQVQNNKNLDQ